MKLDMNEEQQKFYIEYCQSIENIMREAAAEMQKRKYDGRTQAAILSAPLIRCLAFVGMAGWPTSGKAPDKNFIDFVTSGIATIMGNHQDLNNALNSPPVERS